MTLILEVEYLSGVSFAAIGPDSEMPEWPPQPDRIFSALVATWAGRDRNDRETAALEWLEKQAVPRILASDAERRTGVKVYVPPNDPRSDKLNTAKDVLPSFRRRQPRRFPAARPHDALVRLFWEGVAPKEDVLIALQQLARDTAYVGHSASLTRCRFMLDQSAPSPSEAISSDRCVYPGRFDELCKTFDAGRRPLAGARVAPMPDAGQERTNFFGERWLILEHVAGDMPDLRACALVAKTLRDTLLSGYRRIGLGNDIPEVICGHTTDGKPARAPHLAIVPLPFVGFPYADGHVMGFALIPPQDSAILDDEDFRKTLRKLAPVNDDNRRRVLTVTTKEGTPPGRAFSIGLSPTFETPVGKRSLDPALYTRPASTFATVTPIALDRHLKKNGAGRQGEVATQIVIACRNVGLPEPESVVSDKHSAIDGAPSAYPSGKSPLWMRWGLPPTLASRQLAHAVIRFDRPVEGPVILGAGRFVGLGLCRPIDPKWGENAVR